MGVNKRKELEKFVKWVIKSGDYTLLGEDGFMFYKRVMKFHKMTQKQAYAEFAKEKIEKKELLDKIKLLVKKEGVDPTQVPVKWLKNKLTEKEWKTYFILKKGI